MAPELLRSALGDESPIASQRLGGEDAVVVTPTRTIVYHAGGMLSEESIDEFPHDAERITVAEKRRNAEVTLDYGLEGSRSFRVPAKYVDKVLHPVLAANLSASGVIDSGESVHETYRFSELTLVVTSEQLIKHVGRVVWDDEYETIAFGDITGIEFEEGNHSMQVVIRTDGAADRTKIPSDSARAVRETIADAVCAYHGVDSVEALNAAGAGEEDRQDSVEAVTLGDDLNLLGDDDPPTATATHETATDRSEARSAGNRERQQTADSEGQSDTATTADDEEPGPPDEPADAEIVTDDEAVVESDDETPGEEALTARIEALEAAVEENTAAIREQQQTLERLLEALERRD
jgi:hypothetical protein